MMKRSIRKKALWVAIGVMSHLGANAENFEFSDTVLKNLGFENVDLSVFAGSNDQFTGEYLVDLKLNSKSLSWDYPVSFYTLDGDSKVCFTDDLLEKLRVKKEFYADIKKTSHQSDIGECYNLENLDSAVKVEFVSDRQRLEITMPQKYVGSFDENWVAPSERDYGINGVILDYSLFWDYSRSNYGFKRQNQTSIRSYGTTGFNLDRYRFRATYQYSNKNQDSKLTWTQIYGFTDIASINSKLYAGEIYTRSQLFDNTRVKGLSLYSDENMMPDYLRGYAPEITGIANSNAIVTVSQNGNVIRSIQVPIGPFAISDLPTYVTGVVDVEVEEEGGDIRRFQVNIAQVPFLARKGSLRYYANVGKIDSINRDMQVDTKLVSVDGSYGLTNNISIFGGVQYTTNQQYKAYSLGIGANLDAFGAISFDVTQSRNTVIRTESGKEYSGHSYRFNYAKRFSSNTNLNIAGYRFSSREFTSLGNYLNFINTGDENLYLEKNRVSLSLSHYVPEWDINFTGTISKGSYWNKRGMSSYSIAMNKVIREGVLKDVSLYLGFTQETGSYDGSKDRRLSLNMSIPFEVGGKRSTVSYYGTYSSRDKGFDHQVSYSGQGLGGYYSIAGSLDHQRDFGGDSNYGINGSFTRDTGYGQFMAFANYSDDYSSLRTSFDGSLTITKHGIATHGMVYADGSRVILDAGAPGVKMPGDNSVKSNTFGLMGISNTTSYRYNTYAIDNDNLPENVEIRDGVVQAAMTDGAIIYRSLDAISGEKAIATISLPDGSHPPFGAMVYRKNGEEQEVSIIAENGLTYLTGVNRSAEFIVKWNNSQCQLKINSLNHADLNNIICY